MSDALLSAPAAAFICRLRPSPPRLRASAKTLLFRLPHCSLPETLPFSVSSSSISPARRPYAATVAAATAASSSPEGRLDGGDAPTSIELEPISGEEEFDRVLADGQRSEESVVVLWMANWCRKCIFLKPKLEKLAANYYPRIRFYCVDVNTVPQRLVNRAGITKMPTIQLWNDSKKQAEVIGGHKAWLVIDDVRRMIENGE